MVRDITKRESVKSLILSGIEQKDRDYTKLQELHLLRHAPSIDKYDWRFNKIAAGVKLVCEGLGVDIRSEHMEDTPARVAKMYLNELCAGYFENAEKVLQRTFTEEKYNQMIFVDGIEVISMCAHHMLPFIGEAKIGYLPKSRVIGLSKLSRVVKMYAARFQIQEALTDEIAEALQKVLQPIGVGVFIEAKHMCSCIRGVHNKDMMMKTVSFKGDFLKSAKKSAVKEEFMELCRR